MLLDHFYKLWDLHRATKTSPPMSSNHLWGGTKKVWQLKKENKTKQDAKKHTMWGEKKWTDENCIVNKSIKWITQSTIFSQKIQEMRISAKPTRDVAIATDII